MVEYQLPKLNTRVRFPSLALAWARSFKNIAYISSGLVYFAFSLAGCATIEGVPEKKEMTSKTQGMYHKVQKGETLWRIAKAYQKEVADIIAYNNIPDAALIEENQLVFIPGAQEIQQIPVSAEDPNKDEFIWPLKGKILKYFGERSSWNASRGITIEAQEGEAVHAARPGKVVFADYLAGYAYTVILDHLDGYMSVYGQNAALSVKLGDPVLKGAQIAKVGRSGTKSFLHFEIRKGGVADNPLFYLPR